jgi:two-component system sensor histidine kinase/response regulator
LTSGTALHRVNGNAALLRRLIVNFGESYATAGATIRDLLAAGRRTTPIAISIRSRAWRGHCRWPACPRPPTGWRHGSTPIRADDIDALIAELETQLAPAIRGAQRGWPAPAPADQPAPDPRTIAPRHLAAAREALRDQIRRGSLSARRGFDAYADALGIATGARPGIRSFWPCSSSTIPRRCCFWNRNRAVRRYGAGAFGMNAPSRSS